MFQVGWDTKPEDDHSAKLLRSTVISLLDNFACDDEVVLKEVSAPFKAVRRVEVVVVVGGFSEHKQRRLLCGGSGEDLEPDLES